MRTTLTLEPDVARRLEDEQRRTRRSFKDVVNEALRRGLALAQKPSKQTPFRVEPHHCGFKPGIDLGRLNQLYDELEAAHFVARLDSTIQPKR